MPDNSDVMAHVESINTLIAMFAVALFAAAHQDEWEKAQPILRDVSATVMQYFHPPYNTILDGLLHGQSLDDIMQSLTNGGKT